MPRLKIKPFDAEFRTQMRALHDWIFWERIEALFGKDKIKHRLKAIKLQRLYDRLMIARGQEG